MDNCDVCNSQIIVSNGNAECSYCGKVFEDITFDKFPDFENEVDE